MKYNFKKFHVTYDENATQISHFSEVSRIVPNRWLVLMTPIDSNLKDQIRSTHRRKDELTLTDLISTERRAFHRAVSCSYASSFVRSCVQAILFVDSVIH